MMMCGDGIVSYKGHIMNQETYEAIRKAEKQKEQEELEKANFQSFSMVCKKLGQATELLKDTLLMAQVEGLKGRYETVDEIEQFLNGEGCPDCLCEDCTKEDCGIKELGLVEVEK